MGIRVGDGNEAISNFAAPRNDDARLEAGMSERGAVGSRRPRAPLARFVSSSNPHILCFCVQATHLLINLLVNLCRMTDFVST